VRTVPGTPVVLVELTPAAGVSRFVLIQMLQARQPGFVGWSPT
jgi:hypothetical protein